MQTRRDYEAELDETRIKLYEKTRDMTVDERVKWTNERGQRLAARYGFVIGKPGTEGASDNL